MNEHNEVRPGDRIQKLLAHELRRLHDYWWCFLAPRALLIVCGTVAIVYPFVGTTAVVAVLGAMLLISGVATIISSFWTGQWSRVFTADACWCALCGRRPGGHRQATGHRGGAHLVHRLLCHRGWLRCALSPP